MSVTLPSHGNSLITGGGGWKIYETKNIKTQINLQHHIPSLQRKTKVTSTNHYSPGRIAGTNWCVHFGGCLYVRNELNYVKQIVSSKLVRNKPLQVYA